MLGTGFWTDRVRGEDRFYIPVKDRKNQSQNQLQRQKQVQRAKPKSDGKESSITFAESKVMVSEDKNPKEPPNLPPSEPLIITCSSNLSRFLESTTPSVAAQYLSKTIMRGRTCDVEFQPYFLLGDLWEFFKEWSAYGAGVPLILDGSDSVVQYYVPYLSGIQLYGGSKRTAAKPRHAIEDNDDDFYRDSSSDGSGDYETEIGMKYFRDQQGHHISDIPLGMDRLSLSDSLTSTQNGFYSDEGEAENSRSHRLFEFLEQDPPYSREPLAGKISDLACHYPELMTLRSCDLLPESWISVAWYPIYRIPTGPTLRDLDACFLTYHSLSTSVKGRGNVRAPVVVYPSDMDGVPKISLPVFGMASYKFRGSVWIQNGVCELQLANSLAQAVDKWLGLLQVNHPDFQFFASHGTYHM